MQQTGNDNKFDEIEDNFEETDNTISEEEEIRNSERRRRRREEMRRIKRQQELIRQRAIPLGGAVIILLVIIISVSVRSCHKSDNTSAGNDLDIQTQSSYEDISGSTGNDVTGDLKRTSENTNESVTGAADSTTTIGEEETIGTSDDIVDSTKEEVNDNIEDNEESGSSMIDESQLSGSEKMTVMSEGERPNKNTTVQARNILSGVSGNVLYESIIGTITEASTQAQAGSVFQPQSNADTTSLPGDVVSTNGIVVDVDTGIIVAQRDCEARISPASMTKILTVLVAAEHVDSLDDTFTITRDITDYSFSNECSNVGFDVDETVTVRDLFYGTILPSGADAALGLAIYVAGSHEAFVDMMNDKLEELGIADTAHFTNCVGLYDENHYCTVYDMAVILKAAIDNELSKEVLSAHTYTTSQTEQHPDGMILSNWFLRRIEDKDTHGEVVCAKTGYVLQSGSCSASYAENENGKRYICVTAHSSSSWSCIYDHVAIYDKIM